MGNRKKRAATAKKTAARKLDIKKLATLAAGVIVVAYFSYVLITQQISINKKNREIDDLKEQISQAAEESDKLRGELDNLNDPKYLEKIARERLGLVRPNERVFVDSNKSEENSGN